uniref:Uncharacterized protein n=1 Tax=Moumouvirus sp. 'Monve' TaxID=1128131 RepID=H2ECZ7_9VIRU|nr:hypothetical protein mv_L65 [Moumouvirus Monve]
MKKTNSRFHTPGKHYTFSPIKGYQLVMCMKNINGTFNFSSEPIAGIAVLKIPSFTKVITPEKPNIEGHITAKHYQIESLQKFDGNEIDEEEYICIYGKTPFDVMLYKRGFKINSTEYEDIYLHKEKLIE